LNFENLLVVHETRQHLLEIISSFGFDLKLNRSKYPVEIPILPSLLNRNSKNDNAILSALAIGLYPNCVVYSPRTITSKPMLHLLSKNAIPVTLHSQSSLSLKDLSSRHYTFNSIQLKTREVGKEKAFVFDISAIPILNYPIFCANEIDLNLLDGILDLDGVRYKVYGRTGAILMVYKDQLDSTLNDFLASFKINQAFVDWYLDLLEIV
jgi:hypothetical protein